ncbi:uncharacterized protein LOC106662675 [Cimex lectularius]|uniref:Uncharacterized protein n=1 Tax=Cimex lectularius TaxID=79782 RepID=A0A8I6TDX2_CIMLE|nr:uncharacterized protein LOC106662675 [Cimex lectularius]
MPDEEEETDTFVAPKGYCRIFSLQAGTCITSTIGVTLMLSVIIYNVFAENRLASVMLQITQYFFIYIYSLIMFVGFGLVSFAAFLGIPKTLMIGYYLNFSGFILWVILCIISYIPTNDAFMFVCIDNRCPETHWLYDTRWRNYGFVCPFDKKATKEDESPVLSSLYIGCENYEELPMTTSTILGIAWGIFMAYGLYTYKQFKKELTGELDFF